MNQTENKGITISFINDKGGVTKSTSSICLAVYLMSKGKRVAIVDADARHTCLDWAAMADQHGHDVPLVVAHDQTNVGSAMKMLANDYDYVICDGMSSFINAGRRDAIASIIKASDHVLIPTQPNAFDVWAIEAVAGMIKERQEITDGFPKAYIYGASVRDRTNEWRDFLQEVENAPFPILESYLPQSVDFPRSTGEGMTPLVLGETSRARQSVEAWGEEIMEQIHNG